MEYYTPERKKELLSLVTACMEVESIMLSEVSEVMKDKYHMISPKSGTLSTKQRREQNRTRDMEIKNKLTVSRGNGAGGKRGKEEKGLSRNMCKGPIDKDNRGD